MPNKRHMSDEQLAFAIPVTQAFEPDVATTHAEKMEIPDFSGTIKVIHMLPKIGETSLREEEIIRRNKREDTLNDHANFNPQEAAKVAGTVAQPREFRKPAPKQRRPFSPLERARGDKGTDWNTQ